MSGLSDITASLENSRNCLRRIARHDEQQFSKDSLVNVMEKFVKTVNYMDETILVPCRLMDRKVGDATDATPLPEKSFNQHHNHNNSSSCYGSINKCRKNQQTVNEFLNAADLFNLYNTLKSLKNDLLWTRNDIDLHNFDNHLTVANTSVTIIRSTSSVLVHNNNCALINNNRTSSSSLDDQEIRCKCNDQQNAIASSSSLSLSTNSSINDDLHNNIQQKLIVVSSSNNLKAAEPIKGHIRRPSTASMTSSNSVSNFSDSESEISNENDSGIESEGNCGEKGRKLSGNIDKATELAKQCRTHLSGLYRCLEQMTEAANYLTTRYQSDVGPV